MHIERVSIKSTGALVIYKKKGTGEEIPYSLDSREQVLENPRHNARISMLRATVNHGIEMTPHGLSSWCHSSSIGHIQTSETGTEEQRTRKGLLGLVVLCHSSKLCYKLC